METQSKMVTVVWRPANGISLNAGHREYLTGDDGDLLKFTNNAAASEFLLSKGFSDEMIDTLHFERIDENSISQEVVK